MPSLVGIVGAGFQGRGVGYRLALGGHEVVLVDPEPAQLERAIAGMKSRRARARVRAASELAALRDAALVIENVPESLALKRRVLGEIERAAPGAVLASNSSSFPPATLAEGLAEPHRFLNLHFLGPSYGNEVLEVVRGPETSDEAADRARGLMLEVGLDPVEVGGCRAFVYNRIASAGVVGLGRAVDLGLIDEATFLRYALPGPRQLDVLDHVGLDVIAAVIESCREAYGPRYRVPDLVARRVAAGELGVKTGRGLLDHRAGAVARRELPVPISERPSSPFRRIALRGLGPCSARFAAALLLRPDRVLVLDPAERAALEPRDAEPLARARDGDPLRAEVDLLIDAGLEPDPAAALWLSPIGRREGERGIAHHLPGYGATVELVRGSPAAHRALLEEAFGRVLVVEDGPVRPLAMLAVPRLAEAARLHAEGVASAEQIVRLLGGEDPIAEVARWGDRFAPVLREVYSALGAPPP